MSKDSNSGSTIINNNNNPKLKLSNSDFADLLSSLKLDSSLSPVHKIETDINVIKNFSCRSIDEAISEKNIEKRSKFKTIKILVISNHRDFEFESQCLIHEVQPELQQYFMQFGYDFHFVDCNLNFDFDPFIEPYLFEYIKNELDDCFETSEACFVISMVGNRYGRTPLPLEITKSDYELIQRTASNLGLDIEILNSWYQLNELSAIPTYKIKSLLEVYPNLYNKNPNESESYISNHKNLLASYEKLTNVLKLTIANLSNDCKLSGISNFVMSGCEMLMRSALAKNPDGCFVIHRHIEGIENENENAWNYIDITNKKFDAKAADKQRKYIDFIQSQVKDENKHQFIISWKDNYMNILENWFKYSEEEIQQKSSKNDSKIIKYYQKFNSVIISKLKNLIEKNIYEEKTKVNERLLYNEVTRHLYKFQSLSQEMFFKSEEFTKRIHSLIEHGKTNEHNPIFIYGSAMTGKTLTLVNFANIAFKSINSKKCLTIIKFCDLTSQCSTFETLLLSICEQLCVFNLISPKSVPKHKNISQLVEFFFSMCKEFSSRNENNLLILIDGLKDFNIEKSLLNKTNISNNQISWLFNKLLPLRVHMIVTIKRIFNKTKLGSSFNSINSLSSTTFSIDENMVPLFLSYFNDNQHDFHESNLFELPLSSKSIKSDINMFIKNELAKKNLKLIYDQINQITQNAFKACRVLSMATKEGNNSDQFFLYTNLVLYEIMDKSVPFIKLNEESFPEGCEAMVKTKIQNIEKSINSKIFSIICKYITASLNGVTEIEILDLISCNNQFFLNFYKNTQLPVILRFPTAFWIIIKNMLGNLLVKKFLDNKVTFTWRNELIKKVMKNKFLQNIDQIRLTHKDMVNYFLESFIDSKPLIDLNQNLQIRNEEGKRFVAQQPLLYSETNYNYRRLSELWYHLMNSGDVHRLKEATLFNFEYLLSKCHGTSVYSLLSDMDAVLRRILDPDIIMLNSFLKQSTETLLQDPLRLAPEILAILRSLKDDYGEHVKLLFDQANVWCDQHDSPVLIPLTSWLESPESLLVSRIDHHVGVFKLAVTSFSQHVFFSNSNIEICMYHIPSKKMVRKLIGHTDIINSLQITSSNKLLLSCSSDKTLKVWNLSTGEIQNTFHIHNSPILCSVLTNSDEYIITGTAANLISVIRIETGEIVYTANKHTDSVTALAITKEDSILISASADKSIIRWCLDENGLELVDIILTLFSPVTSMVITQDRTFIIIACENKTVQVKSLITGSDVHDLPIFNTKITSLAVSNDCKLLYVSCSDSKLYLYNLLNKELIAVLIEQNGPINDLRISEDNSFLFSSSGNSLFVLNIRKKKFFSKKKLNSAHNKNKLIRAVALSKEGDLAVTGNDSGKVCLWNIIDGELTDTVMEAQKIPVCALVMASSHLYCVIAYSNNTVIVYDIEIGDVAVTFMEHTNPVKHLFILDSRILSGDGLNCCKIWFAHSGQLLESITVDCFILSLSPNKKFVVSGKGDNIIKIWSLSEYKVVRTIDHPYKITVTVFTKDSNFLITGSEDNNCKIWELGTGKLTQVLIEHSEPITSIDANVEKNLAITGSKDKAAILWNFRDGFVSHRLPLHNDIVVKVFLTSNASIAVTASRDSIVNVWSTTFGYLLTKINLQYTLADFYGTVDGDRLVFRFEDCCYFPIVGLSIKDMNTSQSVNNLNTSFASLKSAEVTNCMRSNQLNNCLPIKPKLRSKNSKYFIKFSIGNKSLDGKNILSELNSNSEASGSLISPRSSTTYISKTKTNRKVLTSSEIESSNQQVESKCKKTKICSLV